MLKTIFATKLDMTQAWSSQGKRLAVTRFRVDDNAVIGQHSPNQYEIGYGQKKLDKMSKPLKSRLQQSGFSIGFKHINGINLTTQLDELVDTDQIKVGDLILLDKILQVGDIVSIEGVTKGKGFTGVMKRHGFKGGPRTHGQSDRERAPGSIGAGTDPGRVWPGLKMAGRHGGRTKTIKGLVVLYLDPEKKELWLNGPVPGYYSSLVKITKTGQKKEIVLDKKTSGIIQTKKPMSAIDETQQLKISKK